MNTRDRVRITGLVDSAAIGAYVPTNYANCELWLAADRITANDGDAVSTWADLSGNSRDFTQGTAARQPVYKTNIINGKPIVRFADDYVSNAAMKLGPLNTFIFAIQPGSSTPQGIFDTAPNTSGTLRNYSAGNIEWHSAAPSFALSLANANPVLIVLTVELIPTRRVIYYKNGALISTNTDANLPAVVWNAPDIGAVNNNIYYAGDIAEVVMYSRVLSATERKNASDYLMKKYAI